jgi:hypothetical protein
VSRRHGRPELNYASVDADECFYVRATGITATTGHLLRFFREKWGMPGYVREAVFCK